jgi:hypothetical protein
VSFLALARGSFWLLFGAIWALVGTVFLVVVIAIAISQAGWQDAATATGIVLTKDIVPADSDSSTRYSVTYRFTAPGGQIVEGRDDVSVDEWERLVERGPVQVQYQPARPATSRLTAGDDMALLLLFGLFALVFGGIGWVLTIRGLRGVLWARRILATGVAADAKVIAVESTNVTVNRRPQARIRYSYRDAQGAAHEGQSGYLGWNEANDVGPGGAGRIRYDPARPTESVWLGPGKSGGEKTPKPARPDSTEG